MMQRNRQPVLIGVPQLLKHQLGLAARIDEDERHRRLLDGLIHFRHGKSPGMPRPRNSLFRDQDIHIRRDTSLGGQDTYLPRAGANIQPVGQRLRLAHRRRQANEAAGWSPACQRRKAERQEVAALRGRHRMDLVHNHAFEVGKEFLGMIGGKKQRELFRRGQQYVRRRPSLALTHMGRRIPRPAFDPDAKPHVLDRPHQVALHICCQRLQRRDVERVQSRPVRVCRPLALTQFDQAAQKARQRLAAAGRRDQKRAFALQRLLGKRQLVRPRLPATPGKPGLERFWQEEWGNGGISHD